MSETIIEPQEYVSERILRHIGSKSNCRYVLRWYGYSAKKIKLNRLRILKIISLKGIGAGSDKPPMNDHQCCFPEQREAFRVFQFVIVTNVSASSSLIIHESLRNRLLRQRLRHKKIQATARNDNRTENHKRKTKQRSLYRKQKRVADNISFRHFFIDPQKVTVEFPHKPDRSVLRSRSRIDLAIIDSYQTPDDMRLLASSKIVNLRFKPVTDDRFKTLTNAVQTEQDFSTVHVTQDFQQISQICKFF